MGSFMGKSPSGSTTTTSSPWAGAVPYLTGENAYGQNMPGMSGTMPSAMSQYQSSGWSPQMSTIANNWQSALQGPEMNAVHNMGTAGNNLMNGMYAPNISPVNSNITAPQVNVGSALNSMGGVNPSSAIQQELSGQVAPGMMGSIGNEAGAMYGQATQNLLQQVMPQIDSQAIGAGGYGGSRQGIAQGLALSNMQQNLSPAIAGLYNNANQTAQANQNTTANNMAGIGTNTALANASNSLQAQQAAAQVALANNQQALQSNQLGVANMLAGNQMSSNAANMGNQAFQTGMSLTQAPNQYNWQNLNNYNGVINGTAGLGGSQTQPYYMNQAANLGNLGLTGVLGYRLLAGGSGAPGLLAT